MASLLDAVGSGSTTGGVPDFRSLLTQKLSAKQSTLKATEDTLRRYSATAAPNAGPYEAKSGRFQHRLGPPVNGGGNAGGGHQTTALRGRLGPPAVSRFQRRPHRVTGPDETRGSDEETPEERVGGAVKSVLSRVVIEQKSREDALKEKQQDKKEVQRNRRMFGNLLGTLQRFRQDETKIKDKVEKKREIEQKIDEKTAREKQELVQEKRDLVQEKKRQQHEIRVLQVQMKRVEQFEAWEKGKRHEMNAIRTSNVHPHTIYYCPREHNEITLTKLEETMDLIENEIKEMRAKFEEDLLKIDEKVKDLTKDPELEDFYEDEQDEDENPLKPKSRIVSAIVVPQSNDSKDEEEVAPPSKRSAPVDETNREIKRSRSDSNDVNGKPAVHHDDEQVTLPEKASKPQAIVETNQEDTSLETKPKRERYRSKSPSGSRPRSKSPVNVRPRSKSPVAASSRKKRQSSPSPRTLKKKRTSSSKTKVTPKKRRRRESSSSNSSDSSESDSDSSQSSYSDSSSSSSSDASRSSDSSEDDRKKKRSSKKSTSRSSKNAKKDLKRSKKTEDVDLSKVKKEPKIKQEGIKQEKKD